MKTSRPARRTVAKRARRTKPTAPEPILAATDLVKEYRSDGAVTRALDGVSMGVPAGGFLAVMGPSGSGKSTLLHLLGGLDAPTSGEVLLEGRPLSGLSDRDATLARRGSVGFVFQFFNLVPVLTVAENIALPLVIAGDAADTYRERLEEVIDQTGLEDCANKLPSQISGGQQQRAAIARAIFPRPAVVLADELTGNLDTRTSRQVLQLLKSLQDEHGQTVVIVTHDPQAAAFGDEVIYLEDGKVRSTLSLSGSRARARSRANARQSSRKVAPPRTDAKGGERRSQTVLAWLQKLGA